jgi:photosystem II stability/assembly factor-like uncharacterized protein
MQKKILILVFWGAFFRTVNAQWTPSSTVGSWDLNHLQMVSSTQGFMVSLASVWSTTNAGINWNTLHYIQADSLYYQNVSKHGLYFFNSTTGVVVGKELNNKSIIIRTTNGGTLWTTVYLGTTGIRFKDVWFTDANNGIAVGTGGKIVKTIDGGLTWNSVSSGTTADLAAVHFDPSDPNIGVISGDDVILRTTNGGGSWVITNFTNNSFSDISFGAAGTAYACGGYTNALYKTINSGASWQVVPTNVSHFSSVYFVSADTGYAGNGGGLYRTTDGGLTWEEQGSGGDLFIYFYNSQLGFAGGFDGEYTRTANAGGNSWRPIASLALSGNYGCTDSTYYFSTINRSDYTYQWRLNNQLISTHASDSAVMIGSNANKILTVIVSNGFMSDTVSQTFYTTGHIEFTVLPLRIVNDSFCSGDYVEFYIDSTIANVDYQLFVGNQAKPVRNGTGGTVGWGVMMYTTAMCSVVATRSTACGNYQVTVSRTVVSGVPGNVSLSAVEANICVDDTAKVQILLSEPGTTYTLFSSLYNYSAVTGNGSTVYLSYPMIGQSKTFNVRALNYLGCTVNLSTSVSFVADTMQTAFTRVEDVLVGEDIQLHNQSDGDSYIWTFDASASVATDTAFEPSPLSYSAPGERIVFLNATSLGGCDDTVLKRVRVFESMGTATPGQICDFDTVPTPSSKILAYHVDRFGNQYIAGYTTSTQGGNYTGASYYYFLQKINKNGQLAWQSIQSPANYNNSVVHYYGGYITAITTDPYGNIYVCGNYGCLNFKFEGWGLGNPVETAQNYYIAKLDSSGSLQWITHSYNWNNNSSSTVGATDILYVDTSHIYVSIFASENTYYAERDDSIRHGSWGSCILRINSNGYYQSKFDLYANTRLYYSNFGHFNPNSWAVIPARFIGVSPKMHLLRDGKIELVGICGNQYIRFGNDTVKGYGMYAALLDPVQGWQHAFKIPYNGNWYNGGAGENPLTRFPASCVDGNGNLYIATPYIDTVWYGNGKYIAYTTEASYISRYSPTGQMQWSVKNNSSIRSLALADNDDKIYAYGEYNRFIGIVSATGDTLGRLGSGSRDAYISALDSTGNFLWLENIGGNTDDGAHLMVKDCGGILNCLGYTSGSVQVQTSSVNTTGYRNFILKYDPASNNCQQQTCPVYIDDYRFVYDTLTVTTTDTSHQYLHLRDSVTVFSNFNALDTVHIFDTLLQLVTTHRYDTIHHSSLTQTFDAQWVIYYNHHIDSVLYTDSVIVQFQYLYTDTMRIIKTIDTTHVVGMADVREERGFFVIPNPATNLLTIETNGILIIEINIYNIAGSLLSQTKHPFNKYIDISQLADGVYIAEIKATDTTVRRKWVKM